MWEPPHCRTAACPVLQEGTESCSDQRPMSTVLSQAESGMELCPLWNPWVVLLFLSLFHPE